MQAIAAADEGWDIAYAIAEEADPVATDVLTWLRLRAGDAPFAAYQDFMARRPNWPSTDRLRAEAEGAIEKAEDPATVIAWFADAPPQTGTGLLRLAEALLKLGHVDEGPLGSGKDRRPCYRSQAV